ncbi:hypothetical protein XELAEV_18028625mg [Xenopus laevis]|uniref:Uncharacterized protein n=1 Tax=Xenopus laevis TaxID=8355 RepID=A0A974CQS6_XENLA|nr:hypothetical protein XELAEV_18028625mg [Xenopus laevis]
MQTRQSPIPHTISSCLLHLSIDSDSFISCTTAKLHFWLYPSLSFNQSFNHVIPPLFCRWQHNKGHQIRNTN